MSTKTLKDVAEKAGVSSAAASLVLNGISGGRVSIDAAARVLDAADQLKYRPNLIARSLRTQATKTIGLISDNIATTPYAGQMLAGAQDVAWKNGWLILIVSTEGDKSFEATAIDTFIQRNVDGFLYASMFHKNIVLPPTLSNREVVMLDCSDKSNASVSSIVPDEYSSARTGVEYLISQGHRKIAHLTTSEQEIAVGERKRAYLSAMKDAGLEVPGEYLLAGEDSNTRSGYELTKKILERTNLPTAIFCYTDRMALGAYEAIQEAGLKVPADISILGFDDQPGLADALRPGLTTIKLPHYEMGAWAATKLLEQLNREHSEPSQQVVHAIECPLVVRGSVSSPRD